jgi:hypothetical protein
MYTEVHLPAKDLPPVVVDRPPPGLQTLDHSEQAAASRLARAGLMDS